MTANAQIGGLFDQWNAALQTCDPDQVVAKLKAYQAVGVGAFILSGYTHQAECDLVAEHVLPAIEHAPIKPRFTSDL